VKLEQIALAVQSAVPQHAKPFLDTLAIVGWITALAGALTTFFGLIAAVASAAWGLIRLYETRTVQNWLKGRREK
jgi:hypothetical protein